MLKLFGHPVSQPTRAVSWLLAIKNEPHEYVRLSPIAGETITHQFMTDVTPFGCVPAIIDSQQQGEETAGVKLAEGPAILAYLCESRGWNDYYSIGNDKKSIAARARMNEWMSWHHGALRKCTTDCFRLHMLKFMEQSKMDVSKNEMLPIVRVGMTKEQTDHFVNKELALSVDDMVGNARWSSSPADSDRVFLCGTTPTVPDLLAYCEIDQLDALGILEGLKKEKPLFGRWIESMKKVEKHDDVRKPLKKLVAGMLKVGLW